MDEPLTDDEQSIDQQVTVEVIPQTVTEIIYLGDDKAEDNLEFNWDEEEYEDNNKEDLYEIGSVDIENKDYLNKSLILDETQSFLMLSPGEDMDFINLNTVYLDNIEGHMDQLLDNKPRLNIPLNPPKITHSRSVIVQQQRTRVQCNRCSMEFNSAQRLSCHFKQAHKSEISSNSTAHDSCLSTASIIPQSVINLSPTLPLDIKQEFSLTTTTMADLKHDVAHTEIKKELVEVLQGKYYQSAIFPIVAQQPKFTCDKCGMKFDDGVVFMTHMRSHGRTWLYACNKCNAAFSSTGEVSLHLRQEHPGRKIPRSEKKVASVKHSATNSVLTVPTVATLPKGNPKKRRRKL